MNSKIIGTVVGVFGVLFWFMPLRYVTFMDFQGYQTGDSIGGITYLLLLALLGYAALSWVELHVPRIITASVALAICLLFLVASGSSAAWGIYGLILFCVAGIILAIRDNKNSKLAKA